MIQLFNVFKTYPNGVKALNDINLKINKGEFVFLVGPSGAGKSTLSKLLIREELPTRGQIMFEGKSIVRMRNREVPLLRRKIGFVFQDFRLLSDRTVYENVAFALEVLEVHPSEIKKRVPAVLNMVGLTQRAHLFPNQLSGGEQQRAAIARAVVNNPLLLIADEPTGNLDPESSRTVMNLLADINRRGTTVIMATHARDIVDAMKKRVIAIEHGRIVRDQEKGGYGCEN